MDVNTVQLEQRCNGLRTVGSREVKSHLKNKSEEQLLYERPSVFDGGFAGFEITGGIPSLMNERFIYFLTPSCRSALYCSSLTCEKMKLN